MSYLTDVANTWLVQAIHGLKTMDVFSVHGFSEPGRMICTVSYLCFPAGLPPHAGAALRGT